MGFPLELSLFVEVPDQLCKREKVLSVSDVQIIHGQQKQKVYNCNATKGALGHEQNPHVSVIKRYGLEGIERPKLAPTFKITNKTRNRWSVTP